MSLSDQIFPPPPARDGNILRLGLVGSWESQFLGLGRLTAFLTPRLMKQSHAVDDMGLYVIFLQRHRVEVGLKLILERANQQIPNRHEIRALVEQCAEACTAAGFSKQWHAFVDSQQEYLDLIDQVDPGAATFRYPVDKHSKPWPRRSLVDLVALETVGKAFDYAVVALIGQLCALEPVPVSADDAEATVSDLMTVAWRCRGVTGVQCESMKSLRAEVKRATAGIVKPPRPEADAYQAYDSVVEVGDALAVRAEAMAERIVIAYGVECPNRPVDEPRAPIPQIHLVPSPGALKAQQDAQIKWLVDGLLSQMRPLGAAVAELQEKTEGWSTPAARQVHLDVTRFRSRLHAAMPL